MSKDTVKVWLANARVGATMQSLTPAVLAAIMAIGTPGYNPLFAILAVIGVVCAHLAMNLSDDYFDYRADMAEDRINAVRKGLKAYTPKYTYLKDGSTDINGLRKAMFVFVAIAVICGVIIAAFRGWPIIIIAAIAGFLGVFYTAPPLKLAYYGLGEIVTGFIFGPLLMAGMSYACTGELVSAVMMLSIPVGLLVMNILFTHSYLDYQGDDESDKITLAGAMYKIFKKNPHPANLAISAILNFLPFVLIVAAVAEGKLHWLYLLLFALLPRAIWLWKSLVKFSKDEDINKDIENPAKYLGNLGDWEAIKKAGLGWFLLRWLTARNLVSGLSLMAVFIKIILIVLSLF